MGCWLVKWVVQYCVCEWGAYLPCRGVDLKLAEEECRAAEEERHGNQVQKLCKMGYLLIKWDRCGHWVVCL